jgi:ABC-type Fe3+/spermidine/putrescine transport system ATPase subunit
MSTVAISLENVRKSYGTAGAAVDGVTIAIREGEFC